MPKLSASRQSLAATSAVGHAAFDVANSGRTPGMCEVAGHHRGAVVNDWAGK